MAGISTKGTLESAVEGWLKRTDLTAYYDIWEQAAEEMFKAPPRAPQDPQMPGIRASITRASSTLSTSNAYISKPSDFLEPISLRLAGNRNLTYISKDGMAAASKSGSGMPSLWTVQDVIQFDVLPDSAYTYELAYYSSPATIVAGSASATNALLTTYPMVYLSAVLYIAFDFNGDTESALQWANRYRSFADSANRAFGDGLMSKGSIAAFTDYSNP